MKTKVSTIFLITLSLFIFSGCNSPKDGDTETQEKVTMKNIESKKEEYKVRINGIPYPEIYYRNMESDHNLVAEDITKNTLSNFIYIEDERTIPTLFNYEKTEVDQENKVINLYTNENVEYIENYKYKASKLTKLEDKVTKKKYTTFYKAGGGLYPHPHSSKKHKYYATYKIFNVNGEELQSYTDKISKRDYKDLTEGEIKYTISPVLKYNNLYYEI